jgi:hypothetical protein
LLRAPEEFPETRVKAINNRGDIVGMAFNCDKNTHVNVLWPAIGIGTADRDRPASAGRHGG